MQLAQMRYFLEVARTGNISAAAKNLFLSQPSLSQSIRNLEEELGIPLLIRHPKSVSLTDAGEQFALHAERIVGSAEQLSELMQKHSRLMTGTLRLGIPWIAGFLGIFGLLRRYREATPGIRYELSVLGSDSMLRQLLSRNLHGAFLVTTPVSLSKQEEELYFLKVDESEYMAWVPKSNPLSEKEELSLSDLTDQTLIMPSPESIFSRQLNQLFDETGIAPTILCQTSLSFTVSQLAAEGLGIGFASATVAEKLCPASCRIVPLENKIDRTVYYVTLKELLDYPTIASFTNYLKNYDFDTPTI
ncbi:MAG: LysR family transcriptional regulator [Oscillospiraceae bacterium]|nr:LysR family transcriptional regulator [Oscillospiraceae bacterium]